MAIDRPLKGIDDYKDWDKLTQHCDILEGLSEIEKEDAKNAFQFLKKEFGEQWLKEEFDKNNPFFTYILNTAPWTRKRITWFAQALKEQKNNLGYESLINRLKNSETFVEAESVLEVADKLLKVGFEVSFDPEPKDTPKVPDLRILNQEINEELYVEVSIIHQSSSVQRAQEIQDKITRPLFYTLPFLRFCGRLDKSLSEKHLDEIVRKIQKKVADAKNENTFQELVIDGTLELGMAPEKEIEVLDKWAKRRNLQVGQFMGPPIDNDEVQRARRKIFVEQKQLPISTPNLLVIQSDSLFRFGVGDIKTAETVIDGLEECVYEFPQILFTVLKASYMVGVPRTTQMKGQHLYISKTRKDEMGEQLIILLNRYCDFKISPATISKVYQAFGEY